MTMLGENKFEQLQAKLKADAAKGPSVRVVDSLGFESLADSSPIEYAPSDKDLCIPE